MRVVSLRCAYVVQKADRSMLDAKVSLSQFDRTTEQLNALIQELLDKLSTSVRTAQLQCRASWSHSSTRVHRAFTQESDFRNLLDEYTRNLEGKLERGELDALRRWIETKLKQLQKLVSSGRATLANVTDEAAGLRKCVCKCSASLLTAHCPSHLPRALDALLCTVCSPLLCRQLIQRFHCISCDRPIEVGHPIVYAHNASAH